MRSRSSNRNSNATTYLVAIDHLAFIRERGHRREVLALYRRTLNKHGVHHVKVMHEDDGICCAIEPWPVTASRIAASLAADGERALWVMSA